MTKSTCLSVQEAAKYLNISVSTMNKARGTGDTARFAKIGRRVVYLQEHLDDFLSSKLRNSTSDTGPAPQARRLVAA